MPSEISQRKTNADYIYIYIYLIGTENRLVVARGKSWGVGEMG